MNLKDMWATDDSGKKFVFTVEMQRQLMAAGLPVEAASLPQLPAQAARPRSDNRSAPAARPDTMEVPDTIQIDPETGKYVGRLKWYNDEKGYGFIARGGGEEIFVHKTGMEESAIGLAEGAWVLYDIEERRKGPEATEVEPYSGSLSQ